MRPQIKRRDRLFAEDPHCRFCGVLMIHPKECSSPFPKNMLTLEHLISRNNPLRGKGKPMQPSTTICCHDCNDKRNKKDLQVFKYVTNEDHVVIAEENFNSRVKKDFQNPTQDNKVMAYIKLLSRVASKFKTNEDFNNRELLIELASALKCSQQTVELINKTVEKRHKSEIKLPTEVNDQNQSLLISDQSI